MSNSQEIDLFVALESGVYLFDARRHRLLPIAAGDLRAMAIGPGQKNVALKAPVELIYVADVHRLSHTAGFQEPGLRDPEVQNRAGLSRRLKLRAEQRVLFGQTVGYSTSTRRTRRRNGAKRRRGSSPITSTSRATS
jgi:hypothetical protein